MEKQQQVARNKKEEKQNEGQINLSLNPTSPPSNSSSLHTNSPSQSLSIHNPKLPRKKNPTPSFAIDLTPTDEIFFHGHLLPLYLLSNLPARFSTDSLDSFTLPITDFQDKNKTNSRTIDQGFIDIDHTHPTFDLESCSSSNTVLQEKETAKSRSFSWIPKWRKGCERRDTKCGHQDKEQKRNPKIDISDAVKKYMRLIKPLLSFRNRKMTPQVLHRQAYSFSGNLLVRNKKEIRWKRGELSAPTSMRTSPRNSGLLVASGTLTPTTSDITMEEVQAAIQSAIAHCKKSITTEDKIKNP